MKQLYGLQCWLKGRLIEKIHTMDRGLLCRKLAENPWNLLTTGQHICLGVVFVLFCFVLGGGCLCFGFLLLCLKFGQLAATRDFAIV